MNNILTAMPKNPTNLSSGIKCSFCGLLDTDVKHMVQGAHVNICGKCVELSTDIIAELDGESDSPVEIGSEDTELTAIELRHAMKPYHAPSTKFIVRRK